MLKKYIALLLAIFSLVSLAVFYFKVFQDEDKIVFMDVSQGDSIYIREKSFDVLIDGGEGDMVLERLGEEMPFYDNTIELLILTHPHLDHLGGLIQVLESYEVKSIVETGVDCQSEVCKKWEQSIKNKGIEKITAVAGQNFKFFHGNLEILFPLQDVSRVKYENQNNSSIVSCYHIYDHSFLLMGDAEVLVEKEMQKNAKYFSSCQNPEVLKIGHHGSKSSSGDDFLDFLKPEIAVISAGKNNQFHHPHFLTLEKLKNRQIKTYGTFEDGSISFIFDENGQMNIETKNNN